MDQEISQLATDRFRFAVNKFGKVPPLPLKLATDTTSTQASPRAALQNSWRHYNQNKEMRETTSRIRRKRFSLEPLGNATTSNQFSV